LRYDKAAAIGRTPPGEEDFGEISLGEMDGVALKIEKSLPPKVPPKSESPR
jgi:hypothetical protein